MRYSDINLSIKRYTHTLRGQKAREIESPTDLSRTNRNTQKAAETGNMIGVTKGGAYTPA
jgi:hypothetical protein